MKNMLFRSCRDLNFWLLLNSKPFDRCYQLISYILLTNFLMITAILPIDFCFHLL